ncbi:hypothetical protein [Pelagicoccus sp. SDUM812003]|uniref:hypothetical protein n=1 Tax=Pelagicoccus sp. SDUM812003 TaxID=3041267 RepID=UPI00280DA0E7|nr:hypothetical protein [Pelagicoccus sp. SDUM812003]MDQ8202411.1 hypothetical protein [Pelagicoccus sp. SDUM812003]
MNTSRFIAAAAACIGVTIVALGWWIYQQSFASFHDAVAAEHPRLSPDPADQHPVEILGAPRTPTVLADLDQSGKPVEIACSTCHSTREPELFQQSASGLDEFHQGLQKQHGELSCLSCHNADNYDELRLADGRSVPFENAMQLCAQCHGPQYRDYKNGSHGGMNGYWDLSRGPRTRNACTVCHDAHSPAYPQLMPVFPPLDLIKKAQSTRPSSAHP